MTPEQGLDVDDLRECFRDVKEAAASVKELDAYRNWIRIAVDLIRDEIGCDGDPEDCWCCEGRELLKRVGGGER